MRYKPHQSGSSNAITDSEDTKNPIENILEMNKNKTPREGSKNWRSVEKCEAGKVDWW